MKRIATCFFLILLMSSMRADPERDFQEAVKTLAAKDYATALAKFEAALASDPDNVRYASEYRQAVIQAKAYDRCLSFFAKLVADHPKTSNAYLNYGFAYVDKIPAAGAITQVILADKALSLFAKAIELKPSWIGYYTRGTSYLFWPKIFGRASLGVADLEAAMKIQKADKKQDYHVRTYIALGDGYWKMDELEKAKTIWREGLAQFPDNSQLKARLSKEGSELKALIDSAFDPAKRVDTNLQELWKNQGPTSLVGGLRQ